jgi:NADPH:quinone reductase-like Zn-dependent oxidoreductase
VILTSSSQTKLDRAKELLEPLVRNKDINAIQTIDYSQVDTWDQEARKMTGEKGVDFVIEIGGRGTIGRSIRSTKQGGLVAVSGYVSTFKSIDDAVLKEGESLILFRMLTER